MPPSPDHDVARTALMSPSPDHDVARTALMPLPLTMM